MCGLLGVYLNNSRATTETVQAAIDLLHHRGPDATGLWQNELGSIVLAHTRLAIIDPQPEANQPMHLSEAGLHVVYNGEIYNWRALRTELEQRGHCFRTNCDTEVLLALYQEYGCDLLDKIDGMFAFALFDEQQQRLFCARDRLGKKPFLFCETADGFHFSSEIPSLLRLLKSRPSVNYNAIANMLIHNVRHIPDPQSAWCGIEKLRPGHALLVEHGRVQKHWRYWHPLQHQSMCPSPERLLAEAIDKRSQADVPIGLLLSGGMDSGIIANVLAASSSKPIHSYTLGANDHDPDCIAARELAQNLGFQHHEIHFNADLVFEQHQKIITSFGEPIALFPLVYTYQIAEQMRKDGVYVAMTGHGADELFAGYQGDWLRAQVSKVAMYTPAPLRAQFAKHLPLNLGLPFLNAGKRRSALYRHHAQECWSRLLHADDYEQYTCYIAEEMEYCLAETPVQAYCDESHILSLFFDNQHSLTIAADFPAMLAGVEVRCPFLDYTLLDYVFSRSVHTRVPFFGSKQKSYLQSIARNFLPPTMSSYNKRGFGFQLQEHHLFRNEWQQTIPELLFEDLLPLFEEEKVRTVYRDFLAGKHSHAALIAKIIAVQIWHKKFHLAT